MIRRDVLVAARERKRTWILHRWVIGRMRAEGGCRWGERSLWIVIDLVGIGWPVPNC